MFQFLLQKIRSKKWMMLCILSGNILFVSIICCISMYSEAIQLRMIERSMYSYMESYNEYPLMISLTGTLTVVSPERHNGALFQKLENMALDAAEKTGVNTNNIIMNYCLTAKSETNMKRDGQNMSMTLQLGFLSDIENHSTIVSGTGFSNKPDENGIYSVIVSEKMLAAEKLILGEVISIKNLQDKDGNNINVKIAGVFTSKEKNDEYWISSPGTYDNVMFMSEELFRELFVDFETPTYAMRGTWYIQYDYSDLTTEKCNALLELANEYKAAAEQETSMIMSENFVSRLQSYMVDDNKVNETLWVLQTPILILLVAFIMMVSKQMLVSEQTEIAVLKSRGAARKQLITMYILQSLIVGAAACVIGVPFGAIICQVLGSANAFMEFVSRDALKINFLSWKILFSCLAAVMVSVIATTIPVIAYADTSIVGHRHKKSRVHSKPFWQRYGIDIIILGISAYGFYSFSGKEDELMNRVLSGESLDPLLYFSSSLFIVGCGLVMIRIINLIIWTIFQIGKKLWSPALYASFIRVIRTRNEQNFIVVFLILTIALGIFDANTARTINANDENNILYEVGADVVLQENAVEQDFDSYLKLDCVVSAAKVYEGEASVTYSGTSYDQISLMGIDTKEFGETAWFCEGLLDSHWYNYLNAMSNSAYGVLVSESFRIDLGMQLGDTIYYTVEGHQTRGIICGFIDYWPGFNPVRTVTWGERSFEINNYLIVANRAQLKSVTGIETYKIYLKTDGSSEEIYKYIEDNNIKLASFTDSTQILVEHKNDSILQGTNGMLTVGFITILVLLFIGFLIYWIMSIKTRTLQFGIFRAMGMLMREIMLMLVNEQFYITGISVAAGVGIGVTASKLFIPMIQIAYAKAENILPLMVISDNTDIIKILAVVSVMIVGCIVILGVLISKTKIAQAIKLGED